MERVSQLPSGCPVPVYIALWLAGTGYHASFLCAGSPPPETPQRIYGTQPILTYDWESKEWSIPIELYISKTVILGKQPIKFELQVDYYVEQPDAFGPEWMVSFNVTPIVPNFIANWISGN